MSSSMNDRLQDFIVDAREHLSTIETSLLSLERQPGAVEHSACVDRCFRAMHSIKGDAGFLGLTPIHTLAHAIETLLEQMRERAPQPVLEAMLAARDRLAVLVDDVPNSGQIDISDCLERLQTLQQEHSPGNVALEFDLAELTKHFPTGLVSFFRRVIGEGTIIERQIDVGTCQLRECLPTGKLRWMVLLNTSRSRAELLSRLGLAPASSDDRTAKLEINLSARSGTMVDVFGRLNSVAPIASGSLTFPVTSLRQSLPVGPLVWNGYCLTHLSSPEILRQSGLSFETPAVNVSQPRAADVQLPAVHAAPSQAAKTAAMSVTDDPGRNRPATTSETDKPNTLRIQIELLDRLMTLVGELTLVRNQSLIAFAKEDGPQRAIIQRLNSVTSELQDATLRARMQPVGNLFNKFPRMIRDLARQLGKQVEIDLHGREVELDKTILEQLSDPLTHLIRNSVDHGIEMPDERRAKGKSATGCITLMATHEDGQVRIEIRDDGRGIDSEAVRQKAISLRLKTEAELERMTPRELFGLILLPGFSTAKKVTEVSGRGVGMDVVKTNIEQLEGTLTIDSVVGHGCSMVLRLPLTLAIIPCLIVRVNGDRFAVPQRELEEVVCLHPSAAGRIEQAYDTEVYRLRDRLLPIVRFQDVIDRTTPFTAEAKAEILTSHASSAIPSRIEYILVLKMAGRRFGLVVDEVHGTEEVVVKPMHPSMKRVGIFTGATIMGDGRVALIADVEGIVEHARLSFESVLEANRKVTQRDAAQLQRVLLFEYGPDEQFALPLLQIRRIEMISKDRMERVGDHEYVTVDGVSTRILRLDRVINASTPTESLDSTARMSLILPKFVPQPMGLLVSRIVDTESLSIELQAHPEQNQSILGSAVVRNRLTLFLDMHRLTRNLFGSEMAQAPEQVSAKRPKRLLLIDDTAFFREIVKRYLAAEGHDVVTAIHGEDGLAKLGATQGFDLIVSDIEMPVMDGWEFAREARRRGISTPILALTSLSGTHYEAKAKDCGFDGFEVKLDHDRLVRKVAQLLATLDLST
ncbi:MAG: hybrid sensor histidine kinase/response regulator [Planctomycetia bacterium]